MNRPLNDEHCDDSIADAAFDELVCRVVGQLETGQRIDMAAVAAVHPAYAERLRQLLPALEAVAALGGGESAVLANHSAHLGIEHESESAAGILGDFRILREIGRGGMGVVYEAEQLSLGRRVALKVLPFAAILDHQQLVRFKNEARAAATLDHPNIVAVYSVGSERGVNFYAMQYIDGRTMAETIAELRRINWPETSEPAAKQNLSDITKSLVGGEFAPMLITANRQPTTPSKYSQRKPLRSAIAGDTKRELQTGISTSPSIQTREYFRSVANLGIQAAEALDHAHSNGILHRDVKPGNLLIDDTGKLWVADFGLARIEAEAGLTMTGDLLGTLRYMSPEQALAKRVVVDHRSDIYSLGATLYELLTLEPAYAGSDRQELLRQIAFEEPRRPRQINRNIPIDLETIVSKAMEKNPVDRYATASEAADDFRRFLASQPIRAKPATLLQQLAKWSRRHAAIVWMSGIAATALLTIGIVGLAIGNAMIGHERDAKQAALADLSASYNDKDAALKSAEDNLVLALKALDEVYLQGIGQERLLLTSSGQDLPTVRDRVPFTTEERRLVERGLKFYEQFAVQNASRPDVRFQVALANRHIGDIYVNLGERERARAAFNDAIVFLNKLTADEPTNPDYWESLGRLYDKLNKTEESSTRRLANYQLAIRAFTKWIDVRAKDTNAYLNRLDIYTHLYEQGLSAEAVEAAVADGRRAVELDPKNVQAQWKYSKVLRARDSNDPLAVQHAEEAIRLDPKDWHTHHNLGNILSLNGEFGRAIESGKRSVELSANETTLSFLAAKYLENGDLEQAFATAEEGIRLCRSPSSYYVRANIEAKRGDLNAALADYESAIGPTHRMSQTNTAARKDRADLYLRLGRYEDALKDLDEMIKTPGQYSWNLALFASRAVAHLHLGHRREALQDLQQALESGTLNRLPPIDATLAAKFHDPAMAEGLRRLAKKAESAPMPTRSLVDLAGLLFKIGMNENAVQIYRRALDDKRNDAKFLNAHAWFLATHPDQKFSDAPNAVELATKACELTGYKSAGILDTLAAAYAASGDFQKAVEWQEKAVELTAAGNSRQGQIKRLEAFRRHEPWREK